MQGAFEQNFQNFPGQYIVVCPAAKTLSLNCLLFPKQQCANVYIRSSRAVPGMLLIPKQAVTSELVMEAEEMPAQCKIRL